VPSFRIDRPGQLTGAGVLRRKSGVQSVELLCFLPIPEQRGVVKPSGCGACDRCEHENEEEEECHGGGAKSGSGGSEGGHGQQS
jgi:hypothetical protein